MEREYLDFSFTIELLFSSTVSSTTIQKGWVFVDPSLLRTFEFKAVSLCKLRRISTGLIWDQILVMKLELEIFSFAILIRNILRNCFPLFLRSWRTVALYNVWWEFLKEVGISEMRRSCLNESELSLIQTDWESNPSSIMRITTFQGFLFNCIASSALALFAWLYCLLFCRHKIHVDPLLLRPLFFWLIFCSFIASPRGVGVIKRNLSGENSVLAFSCKQRMQ